MRLLHIFEVLAHAIALGQDSIPVTKDTLQETNTALTLDTYDFDDFRDMDSSNKSIYPFVNFSKNNYKFYTEKSDNFQVFHKKLRQLIDEKKEK